MKIARIAFATVAIVTSAHAAEWHGIGETLDGGQIELDVSSVVRETVKGRALTKAWFKQTHLASQTLQASLRSEISKGTYTELKSLIYFNCTERRLATTRSIYYAADGSIVGAQSIPIESSYLEDVVPDSIGEAKMESACNLSKTKAAQAGPKKDGGAAAPTPSAPVPRL